MTDCIFCKIIRGEIPCTKIYENHKALAFLDINPINNGHALVMPKEHHETLLDTPDEVLAETVKLAKRVAKAVKEGTGADGVNLGQNNFRAAGQLVFHLHFHVIPRFEGDGFHHWQGHKYASAQQVQDVAKKIREKLETQNE
ncbi:HIT family protein [Candidatus Woesearchaeota archaeon]|nr:HIT family protein [Candidatus Woesearchaeota archaeon]